MAQDKKKSSTELAKDNLESLNSGIEDLKKIQKGMNIEKPPIECQVCGTVNSSNDSNCSNVKCQSSLIIFDAVELKVYKERYSKRLKEKIILCKKCETSNSIDALYCKSCGGKLFEEKKVITRKCDKCGNEYDASFDFCPKDGGKIVKEESIIQDIPKQKNVDNISYKENQVKSTPPNEDELKGIDGWLGFFAFFVSISPIVNIAFISQYAASFIDYLEIGILIYCVVLLFTKKKIFVQVWIAYSIFSCIYITIIYSNADYYTAKLLTNMVIKSYVSTIIWSCYLLSSQRVKNTFIN